VTGVQTCALPISAPQSPSPIIWGWYNRPEVAAVQGTEPHPTSKNKNKGKAYNNDAEHATRYADRHATRQDSSEKCVRCLAEDTKQLDRHISATFLQRFS
jgi:hypothetical protein